MALKAASPLVLTGKAYGISATRAGRSAIVWETGTHTYALAMPAMLTEAGGGGGGSPPAIDGSAVTGIHSGGGALTTAALTTTQSNDIIVIVSSVEANSTTTPGVSSVTGGGLTFARRSSAPSPNANSTIVEVWWALAASALSAVAFTVNYAATYDDAAAIAFGVSGCNTSNPWDSNASLPKLWQGNNATPSFTGVSTTHANDLLLMALGANGNISSFTEASGFTVIGNVLNSGGVNFAWAHASRMAVTTPQSNATYTAGTSLSPYGSGSVDALTADASGGGGGGSAQVMVLA